MRAGSLGIVIAALAAVDPPNLEGQSDSVLLDVVVRESLNSAPVPLARVLMRPAPDTISISGATVSVFRTGRRGKVVVQVPVMQSFDLTVSALGFAEESLSVKGYRGQPIMILLDRASISLPAISVAAEARVEDVITAGESRLSFSEQDLRSVPPAFGIEDPIRSLASHPAIEINNAYSARPVVRGSDPSAVSFHLDGFPIYNPFHSGGLLSGLPTTAISGVDVWTGSYPPWYNSALGSAIDFRVDPTVSTPSVKLLANVINVEGGMSASTGHGDAFRLSLRRSWLGSLWADALLIQSIGFTDLLAWGRTSPTKRLAVSAIGFRSRDAQRDVDEINPVDAFVTTIRVSRYERATSLFGTRMRYQFGSGSDISVSGWISQADAAGESVRADMQFADTQNTLNDRGVSLIFSRSREKLRMFVGGTMSRQSVTSNVVYSTNFTSLFDLQPIETGRLRFEGARWLRKGFVRARSDPNEGLTLGAGLTVAGTSEALRAESDIRMTKKLSETTTLSLSLVRRYQWQQLLLDPSQEPTGQHSAVDFWILNGSEDADLGVAPAPRSDLVTLGAEFNPSSHLAVSVVLYHQDLERVSEFQPLQIRDGFGAPDITDVNGTSYGLETSVNWIPDSRWTMQLGFSWARSWREHGNELYLSDFDVPVRLKGLISFGRPFGWLASSQFTVSSGLPFTPISEVFPLRAFDPTLGFRDAIIPSVGFLLGNRNSARHPINHRVDLRVGYRGIAGRRMVWEFYASILNLTGGQNIPKDIRTRQTGLGSARLISSNKYGLPAIPVVGLKVEF